MISLPHMHPGTSGPLRPSTKPRSRTGFVVLLWVPLLLCTRAYSADNIDLFRPPELKGYFVRASANALFNVGVSVQAIRPVYGDGEYANGYVLPDIGGSKNLTWNWGYNSPAQIDTANDQLTFERYENLPPLQTREERGVAPGGEVLAGLEAGKFKLGKRTVHFGMEAGYGYHYLSVDTSGAGNSAVTYTMAAYSLNGVVPPAAPYNGTFEGPGPLIGLMPASSTNFTSASQASSTGRLESNLHNFKIGLWFDYPINDTLFTSLSAGYACIYADAQFKYTETLTYPAVTTSNTVGGRDNWKPGVYAEWRLGYQVSKRVNLFLGVDYQWNGEMTFIGADQRVTLDFSTMFGASAGVQVNF